MKRIRLLVGLLLALASFCAHASFTVNGHAGNNNSGAGAVSVTISIASGHTVGLWIFTHGGTAGAGTVTDSGGNTYTINNTGSNSGRVWGTAVSIGIASSITSVTFTPGGTSSSSSIFAWDVTATGTISVASSTTVIYSFNTTTTANATTTGTLSVTSGDGLLLAVCNNESAGGTTAGTVPAMVSDGSFVTGGALAEHLATTTSAAATFTSPGAGDFAQLAGMALQIAPPPNGVVMSNGHPVKSGTAILYR